MNAWLAAAICAVSWLGLTTGPKEAGQEKPVLRQDVYICGQAGYHTYRIPALIRTTKGTLLAFAEGRKTGRQDTGDIDLLVKRSSDNGKTWSPHEVVWDDAGNTCGNPCPIVDRQTGTIVLLMTWNRGDDTEKKITARTSQDTRRVFLTFSRDDGASWATPLEITGDVKNPEWTWYATGPGAGIQLERGPHSGRLIAPCDHIEAQTGRYYSHVIFSDDHGKTWQQGGRTPRDQVNECQVIELSNNRLMLNMRNYDRTNTCRQTAVSDDGGISWHDQTFDQTLIEPVCQAALHADSWTEDGRRKLTLFSNPASDKARVNLTVRFSYDEGRSWPESVVLHPGPAAYSDLTVLPDGRVGCLFEAGEKDPYERIMFELIQSPHVSKGLGSIPFNQRRGR